MTEPTRIAVAVALIVFFLLGFLSGWTAASMSADPVPDVEVSVGYDGTLLTDRVTVVSQRLERASRAQAVHQAEQHAHRSFGAHLTSRAVAQRDEHREQVAVHEREIAASREAVAARVPAGPPATSGGDWARISACIRAIESGGNYQAVSPSGKYRGAYQFDMQTWASVGGTGDPAAAPPAEQDHRAYLLWQRRGLQPWPTPAKRCR